MHGFKHKPWPTVTAKYFEHKNFFARYYACRAGSKSDDKSSYSNAFIYNFERKMNIKKYFDFPKDC
jgi:hypothetical protein